MKILAEDDALTITFEGMEIFFALQRKLVIPRSDITDLEWQPEYVITGRLWRIGGTDIPGTLWAGRFRGNGQRYFLYLRRPRGLSWTLGRVPTQETLAIITQNFNYHQVLVTTNSEIGTSLMNWYRGL